jgi:hypothetical protein
MVAVSSCPWTATWIRSGLVVYFLFTLGAIVIGPLEAVLGLAGYWLLTGDHGETTVRYSSH